LDSPFDDKIYIILDNYISKYTKEELKKIKNVKLVFLPYNSPKLNRIEDEFSLYKREVLNNRKFKSKEEIIWE
jgi:transposase